MESLRSDLVHFRQKPNPHQSRLDRLHPGNHQPSMKATPAMPPQRQTVRCFRLTKTSPLTSVHADEKDEAENLHKKRKRLSDTPEPKQTRKHHRQQQLEQTQSLITEMTQAVRTLCSSLQPAHIPPQSPQKRRAAAIR